MTPKKILLSLGLSMMSVVFAMNTVFAHGDEDHSGDAKPTAVSSTGTPTAEAKSDDFELLAQMKGNTLQVYLDRYSDNTPIEKAQIEIESGAFKAQLKASAPGEYSVEAPNLAAIGEHALVFTVIAGEQADLLETTLTVANPATVLDEKHGSASGDMWWWVGGGLAGVATLSLILARQRRSNGHSSGAKA
ncbi:hypothetical protein [Chitinibacter sp. S2-10]|uniref:hypothetical protein n=1 Tax=Chitinibacter sp. S2-10 TaxID=3373597 RepID=UPI00397728C8